VVQITDRCNARCPQCGMRVTESFARSTLATDAIKRMIDAAACRGVQAISFTGGEPLLDLPRLVELIRYAGDAGIPYIRTGTNGFMLTNREKRI
jgi:molybdenum cofactor biosynthesis enzyme MoaA